jgi:hypothetical protein
LPLGVWARAGSLCASGAPDRYGALQFSVDQEPARGVDLLMTERDHDPQALKSRLLADLVKAVSVGHVLQPSTVAVLVGRNASELIQQASGANESGPPSDERVQRHLRNIVTVLSVAHRHFSNVLWAVYWYRTDHLAESWQHTPEALTAAGRLEDAYRILLRTPRNVSAGQ